MPVGKADLTRKYTYRVGVPGGEQIHFESWRTIFSWYGSAWQAALCTPASWAHVCVFALLCVAFCSGKVEPINLPSETLALLRFGAIFNLCFYSGKVLSRFDQRFHDCCKTNGACTLVTVMCAGQLRNDKPRAALLMRYANLMMHLYYLALDAPLDDAKWELMISRGVLTSYEREVLEPLSKRAQAVYTWANRLLHHLVEEAMLTAHEAERIENNLSTVRGLAA
jgi:hypothetical protein